MKKPEKREDCKNIIRPCPYVSCKHNTYLNISETGKLTIPKYNPLDVEPNRSCVLDIVEENPGGLSNPQIGDKLSVSKETIRLDGINAYGKLRFMLYFEEDYCNPPTNAISPVVTSLFNGTLKSLEKILNKFPTLDLTYLLENVTTSKIISNGLESDLHFSVLSLWGHLSTEEIANVLGISLNTFYSIRDDLGLYLPLPGEFYDIELIKQLGIEEYNLKRWYKNGIGYRQFRGRRYISRSELIKFFMKNGKIFYTLKLSDDVLDKLLLTKVKEYHLL